jgi:hypothetical protein
MANYLAPLGTPDFMRLTLMKEAGCWEFATSVTFGDVFQPVASMAAKSGQHP